MFYCKVSTEIWLIFFGTTLSILLRAITTLHPYSGEHQPPMFGDFEAQRHWMEITTNLPVGKWYKNSTDNDLMYWGLDYPPLTAYHMFLCGKIAEVVNGNFTKLYSSRGFEDDSLKLFMRNTVIFGDILLYIPSVLVFFAVCVPSVKVSSKKTQKYRINEAPQAVLDYSTSAVLSLLYPGIILIDHGHFQYNNVSLGFLIFATTFILVKRNIIASIFFCLAVNYKQMELYHALPFFLYLLSTCVPKPGQSAFSGFFKLFKISLTVIITFSIIWLPFLFDINDTLSVLNRLFPVSRGLFEDKVSNFWCTANIFYKFKNKFDNFQMMRICLFTTLSALFPSSVDLFLRPNSKKFVLSLINSSLAFYLFGFQVHEKSILLVSIPVILHFPYDPFVCFYFLIISVFSMLPLFVKENLFIAYISLNIIYIVSGKMAGEHCYKNVYNDLTKLAGSLIFPRNISQALKSNIKIFKDNKNLLYYVVLFIMFMCSLFFCVVYSFVAVFVKQPKRYPDLHSAVISGFSAVHFLGFFVYFNVQQLKISQEFDDIKNVRS